MRRPPIGEPLFVLQMDEAGRKPLPDPRQEPFEAVRGAYGPQIMSPGPSLQDKGTFVMANAMLNIRIVQPRMMSIKQAADYVGLPLRRFPRICTVRPVAMPECEERYDIRDLDLWLDQIKAGNADTDADILGRLG